ncbi:methyltransferase domain-containing protein [Vreelandella andesensis]|uniref:Methyltransferase domain-containing protein n=1 Tax=Vreelandella andesensis TaxID=447567 RepID=A0A3S0Y919_9GAMM|nr:methyltransferase domain-containing protein [Halomonas andesensis]RUR33305.1 methyltransferase domain-containing protein [Halomonas andesensis]
MSSTPFQALACPLDGEPLNRVGNVWRCSAGHSFDVAKQGYVNLLPVQQKRSSDPGDSKLMVAARQRFLDAGYYQPIAQTVSKHLFNHAEVQSDSSLFGCLDAGCGEGYYLRELARASPSVRPLSLIGLDISKWAVLSGAKQDDKTSPLCNWVVGSNAHLPVQTAVLNCVLCMFGFPVHHEFARVLKPGGLLVQVEAGAGHLRELREVIYPTLKPEVAIERVLPESFAYLQGESISYQVTLEGQAMIGDLLSMTPHLYRASQEGRARAAALNELILTVDAKLMIYERK